MGAYGGLHEEVQILKRDKSTLYMELVRMRADQARMRKVQEVRLERRLPAKDKHSFRNNTDLCIMPCPTVPYRAPACPSLPQPDPP